MIQRFLPYVLPVLFILFWVVMFFFFEHAISWTFFFIVTGVYVILDIALRFQLAKGKRDVEYFEE